MSWLYISYYLCSTQKDSIAEQMHFFVHFLLSNKNIRFGFDDELKIRDVRYKHLILIAIKVQLFWRLTYEM